MNVLSIFGVYFCFNNKKHVFLISTCKNVISVSLIEYIERFCHNFYNDFQLKNSIMYMDDIKYPHSTYVHHYKSVWFCFIEVFLLFQYFDLLRRLSSRILHILCENNQTFNQITVIWSNWTRKSYEWWLYAKNAEGYVVQRGFPADKLVFWKYPKNSFIWFNWKDLKNGRRDIENWR